MIRREVAIHLRMGEAYMEEVGGNKGEKKKEKKRQNKTKRKRSWREGTWEELEEEKRRVKVM